MKTEDKLISDAIVVWYCEECGRYYINFSIDKAFCCICGYKMIKRRYVELIEVQELAWKKDKIKLNKALLK